MRGDGIPAAPALPPLEPACAICVTIPVRNEAARLPRALEALAGQLDRHGRPLSPARYEVLVLANNCTDGSAALARRFGARHPELRLRVADVQLPPEEAHVGAARRLAMDGAARRFERAGRPGGLLASTDADTRVAPDWIAALLEAFGRGADAVGGRVMAEPEERDRLPPLVRRRYLLDVAYRLLCAEYDALLDPCPHDPWPRHHQFQGASLAVTVAAYRRVGGLPALPCGEDVALERALARAGARIRHSPDVRAFTSARRWGRAEGGMAAQLQAWDPRGQCEGSADLAESAEAVHARILLRRRLRALWTAAQRVDSVWPERLAGELGLDPERLVAELTRPHAFPLLYDRIAALSGVDGAKPTADVGVAIRELRRRLRALRERAAPRYLPLPALEEVEPVPLLPPPAARPQSGIAAA